MPRITPNPIVDRIQGALGNLVFRRLRGRTFVSRKADTSGVSPSEAQLAHRIRFRNATAYAAAASADPEAREFYAPSAQRRELTVYQVAVGDFLNPPSVDEIDVAAYDGQTGDPIWITATDDAAVTRVDVRITELDGTVIEEGEATLDGFRWVYQAQTAVEGTPAVLVVATAHDRPGNTASDSAEVALSV